MTTSLFAEPSSPGPEADRSKPPKAGPLPSVELPSAVSETLPNGLKLFVLRDTRQPTVTFRMVIKSGALFDGEHPGLAAMTAGLLNKGTRTLSAEAFAQKTDFLGARVEAGAEDDYISVVAGGLSRDTKELLGYFSDAILEPAFAQEELAKEQRTTISELIAQNADPSLLSAKLRNRLLYGKHPYGVSATPGSVKGLTRDLVVAFHKENFVPNNATLVIVGDVDAKEVIAMATEAFDGWKKGEVRQPELPPFPKIENVSYHLVDRPASVQSNLLVSGKGVARNNPDLPELQVVNSVLGGGFSGRLFANLREKNGYTYGAYSGFGARKLGGTFSATAQVRNEVTAAAIGEILNEFKRLTGDPIPEEELNLQRTYLAGNFLISLESDRRIAERFQEIDLYGLPENYWQEYAARLVGVNPAKAEALAARYIDPGHLAVVVVGKAQEVYPQLEKLGPVTVYNTDLEVIPAPEKPKAE